MAGRFWDESTGFDWRSKRKTSTGSLKEKPELLIGTPGRVLELITAKKIKAAHIQTLVFDEVDQLIQGQSLQLIQKF